MNKKTNLVDRILWSSEGKQMVFLCYGIVDESRDQNDECILYHTVDIDVALFLGECGGGEPSHIFV